MDHDAGEAPQRILILTTSYPRFQGDSAGHFVAAEVDQLIKTGHQVTVLCAGADADDKRSDSGGNPRVEFLGGRALFAHPGALPRLQERPLRALSIIVPTIRSLLHRIRSHRRGFDQVIAHWLLPCGYPWALLATPPGVPLEIVAHGSDVRVVLRLPAALRVSLLRTLQRRRATLRLVSNELKDSLLSCGLPPDLVSYVASSRVRASPLSLQMAQSRESARERLALGPSARIVLIAGRLISGKRPDVALSAADLIPDARVVVLGGGPLEAELSRRYPSAEFLGQVHHPIALLWLAAADVVISASRIEGAPTSVREARAARTPVVSVHAGDLLAWSASDQELWLVG